MSWDFLLQVLSWIIFPQASEKNIRIISNFFENSRRYSQVNGHQRHRWQGVSSLILCPSRGTVPLILKMNRKAACSKDHRNRQCRLIAFKIWVNGYTVIWAKSKSKSKSLTESIIDAQLCLTLHVIPSLRMRQNFGEVLPEAIDATILHRTAEPPPPFS